MATQSDGIFALKDRNILHHFTTQNGLSGDNCTQIITDNQTVWVSTNNGISKINLKDNSIKILRKDSGLPSNDIRALHLNGNNIYVGTNDGVAVINKDFNISQKAPNLYFSKIQIENKDTSLLSNYELPHNKNDIRIKFSGVTFKNANEVIYQYKMSGVNKDWIETKVGEVSFPSLNHGYYEFEVKAKSINSDWTSTQKINFTIEKAWWQTYWFYFLITALALFILVKLFQRILRGIKRRNEIKQSLTESQLTALRAQMDPHFLFNALNSIQDFIIQDDKRTANHYLAQFSKLMRNILNASDKNKISLQKEIDYLKLYLSLEALRFEDSFTYEFEVDENLDSQNISIPSMLIQPFVENAIKHGLMHKQGKKELWVRFFKKENYLLCEIEDNGIGREKSKSINQQNQRIYKSKGISLTKERIDLFNAADSNKLGLEIEDLKNTDGSSKGTKVRIRIF